MGVASDVVLAGLFELVRVGADDRRRDIEERCAASGIHNADTVKLVFAVTELECLPRARAEWSDETRSRIGP